MILKKGDRVEHRDEGKGTLVREHDFDGACVVKFDVPNKFGRNRLTVYEGHLRKIEDEEERS